jgi:hypothetical protein
VDQNKDGQMKKETTIEVEWHSVGGVETVVWSPRSGIISPTFLRVESDDSIVVAELCARAWARMQLALAIEAAASAAQREWLKGLS